MSTIQIDDVWHFSGPTALPDQLKGAGPWRLTIADIERLMDGHDIMLHHRIESRREGDAQRRTVLGLDRRGGKFRQR